MTRKLPEGMTVRHTRPGDHKAIIGVMPDWWNGRDLTHMLPKLFLVHFCNTSFMVEKKGDLIAFLIGFMSPANPSEGYIHFSGVHPSYRGVGIGSFLYDRFAGLCIDNNRTVIRACTSPVNKDSIGYHVHMGFGIEDGDAVIEGVQVTLDYNRPDDPKVLFKKNLSHG